MLRHRMTPNCSPWSAKPSNQRQPGSVWPEESQRVSSMSLQFNVFWPGGLETLPISRDVRPVAPHWC